MIRRILTLGVAMLFAFMLTFSVMAANVSDVDQDSTGSGTNEAYITQIGTNNTSGSNQDASGSNYADINQNNSGFPVGNLLTSTLNGKTITPDPTQAIQIAGSGNNALNVNQVGFGNLAGLNQVAGTYNIANILQGTTAFPSSNYLAAWMKAANGYNKLDVDQNGQHGINHVNCAEIYQNASTNNVADVDQAGGNNQSRSAQFSGSSYNKLDVDQTNGYNKLTAWQNNPVGYNDLKVTQTGGMVADVHQTTITGAYNIAIITQQ